MGSDRGRVLYLLQGKRARVLEGDYRAGQLIPCAVAGS
jgi:hypothetical protein